MVDDQLFPLFPAEAVVDLQLHQVDWLLRIIRIEGPLSVSAECAVQEHDEAAQVLLLERMTKDLYSKVLRLSHPALYGPVMEASSIPL